MTITMAQAAALLGLPKPAAHRQRICAVEDCGGDLIWGVELDSGHPWGTGYDIEFCESCGEPSGERTWVGF